MLTSLNLHSHEAVQSRDDFRLVVMSARHLQDLLVLEQAQRGIVIAGDLPDSMTRKRVLQLKLEDALSVRIFANFPMKLGASKVKQAMRGDQDRVVLRARDLACGYLTKADCTGWHECIFGDAQGQFTAYIATVAPYEHALLANLPSHLIIADLVGRHRVDVRWTVHDCRLLDGQLRMIG